MRIQLLKSLQATTYYLNPYYNYNSNFKVNAKIKIRLYVSNLGERCKIDLKLELFRDAKGMYEKKLVTIVLFIFTLQVYIALFCIMLKIYFSQPCFFKEENG